MDGQSFGNGGHTHGGERSSLAQWFTTPAGCHALEWELAQYDNAVDDVFGFRAVQMGLPGIDFLRENRIPYRFTLGLEAQASLVGDPLQVPLATQSMDLVALPHVLESHTDPHNVLREAERILRPEGQLVLSGFNTLSLWRLRQIVQSGFQTLSLSLGRGRGSPPVVGAPWDARFIGLLRLRDWLKLLGFELNGGKFGCYTPPFTEEKWLARFAFMEAAGARWWPIMGGVYVIRAIKRTPRAIVVTPAWRRERARRRAIAAVPQADGGTGRISERKESADA